MGAEFKVAGVIITPSGFSGGHTSKVITGTPTSLGYNYGFYISFTGTLTGNTDIELDDLEGGGIGEELLPGRPLILDFSAVDLAGYSLSLSSSNTVNGLSNLSIIDDIYGTYHKISGGWIAYSITGNFASAGQILQIRVNNLGIGGADRNKVDFNDPAHVGYVQWTALRSTPIKATWTDAPNVEDTMIVGVNPNDVLVPGATEDYESIANNELDFHIGLSVNVEITLRQTSGGVITFVP